MSTKILLRNSVGYYAKRVPIPIPGTKPPEQVLCAITELSDETADELEKLRYTNIKRFKDAGMSDEAFQQMVKAAATKDAGALAEAVVGLVADERILDPESKFIKLTEELKKEAKEWRVRVVVEGLVEFPEECVSRDVEGKESKPEEVSVETVQLLPPWLLKALEQAILAESDLTQDEADFLAGLVMG